MKYIVRQIKVIKEIRTGVVETEIEIKNFEKLLYRGRMDTLVLWEDFVEKESHVEYECVDALKECPFCGGTASIEEVNDKDYMVYCEDCGAERRGYETAFEAIRHWNNRYVEKE